MGIQKNDQSHLKQEVPRADSDVLFLREEGSQGPKNTLKISAKLPSNLHVTDGHFPNDPLVPAFAQLDWILQLARRYSEDLFSNNAFESATQIEFKGIKYLQPLRPAETITIVFETIDDSVMNFSINRADGVVTRGRLCCE